MNNPQLELSLYRDTTNRQFNDYFKHRELHRKTSNTSFKVFGLTHLIVQLGTLCIIRGLHTNPNDIKKEDINGII